MKDKALYARPLYLVGTLNLLLILWSVVSILLFTFSEAPLLLLLLRLFAFAFPAVGIKVLSERIKEKAKRTLLTLVLVVLSILVVPGSIAKTSWALGFLVLLPSALIAPKVQGRLLMAKPQPWDILLFVFLFGMGRSTGTVVLEKLAAAFAFVFILLFLLDRNMSQVQKKVADPLSSVSPEAVRKENRKVLLILLLAFVLLSVLLPLIPWNRAGETVEIPTVQFSAVEDKEDPYEDVRESLEKLVSPKGQELGLAVLFDCFILLLGVVLFASALFFLVRSLLHLLLSVQDKPKAGEGKGESLAVERVEEEKPLARKEKQFFLSPAWRVRRLYRREILSRNVSIGRHMTPEELEDVCGLEEASDFHRLYERARYSEGKVTREDLKKAQEAQRKLRK